MSSRVDGTGFSCVGVPDLVSCRSSFDDSTLFSTSGTGCAEDEVRFAVFAQGTMTNEGVVEVGASVF